MIKKTSSMKNQYNADNLFIGTYGSVVYIPEIDILHQLSLDIGTINKALMPKSKAESKIDEAMSTPQTFSNQVTIKVPVPPPPSEAMVNRRSNQKFPLGTKTDPETGEDLSPSGPILQERSVRNQILYTDPGQGVVYFVDGKGSIASTGLGHLSLLSDNTNFCLTVLDTKISVSGTVKDEKGSRTSWDSSSLESLFYIDPEDPPQESKAKRNKLKSISNVNLDKKGGIPLFMYAKDNNFREFVHSELRSLELKFKTGVADVKKDLLGAYYAQLITAVLFADRHSEFFSKLVADEDHTMSIDPADAPEIPHIKEDTRFLPHQVYALSFLKDRKASLVDADPGAGKTLMLLADIIDKMNRGLVKRPCIIMPNSLLSDQKAEFEGWTQGTMNFIVVNTDTVKESDPNADTRQTGRFKGLPKEGDKEAGLEALTAMIQSAPPNTIILTSYEWLRGGDNDAKKTASGTRYRNSTWLSSPLKVGVDMVVLDESHRLRINASGKCSQQAEAVLQLSSLVPYKRCYTGTVAPGSPDDVFLQMSFLDPAILGSKQDFNEKYSLSLGKASGKIEEWKPGAIKELRLLICKTVGVSIRRSAWLSELPSMKLAYHKATLSQAQRVVYERIMNRIIKEELGLDFDPATGLIKHAEAMPGSVGLGLQKELENKFASNPLAKSQISQWTPSKVVTLSEYDSDEGEDVDLSYEIGDEETDKKQKKQKSFDLSDPSQRESLKETQISQLEAFKKAQAKTAALWANYEQLQGDVDDAPEITDFSPLLTKFIAVDKFLNCPTSDDFGKHFLFDDADKISPKITVINALLAKHFADPSNGKVIIFTHYKDVAKHVLESIDMASRAVYYDSSTTDALAKFKTSDSVQILIAVEQSIQEGQNLQMANRIIRLDLPWNPGNYEQSIARAYRLPPKDPDEKRYSTLYIDLILCEGTAELTKYARMVSKMHAVRQLTSGYKSNARFRVVGMSLHNMTSVNTFASISKHMEVFKEMRDYEVEEAKEAPKVYGTQSKNLAIGGELAESTKIETPLVDSDKERGPWTVKPEKLKKGVINPKVAYLNGAFWMNLESLPGMKIVLRGFPQSLEPKSPLTKQFESAQQAFVILQQLREKGLFVLNQEMLHAKIMGRMQCDPEYPQSKIDYGKLIRVAEVHTASPDSPSEFPVLREGDTATKQVLAYNPSQADLKTAREIILKVSPGKEVLDIHVLAAAKILGLYQLNPDTLDLKNFVRMSNRFRILSSNRRMLEDQLSSLVESPATNSQLEEEDQDSEIPGLEGEPSPTGLPVQLDVAIFGVLTQGKLVTRPAFIVSTSNLASSKTEEILKILKGSGFNTKGNSLRWLLLGETKAQAKSRILDFSRLVYLWYTIGNWDSYLQDLRNLGCTEADIEGVFPKSELKAMAKMAGLLGDYPEYEDLTRSIYGL